VAKESDLGEDDIEQNIRIGLLEHYSSKSSNQGILLLTLALVFFALVSILGNPIKPSEDWKVLGNFSFYYGLWATFLSFFISLGFRIMQRLLRWGLYADSLSHIDAVNDVQLHNWLKLELEKEDGQSFYEHLAKAQIPVSLIGLKKKPDNSGWDINSPDSASSCMLGLNLSSYAWYGAKTKFSRLRFIMNYPWYNFFIISWVLLLVAFILPTILSLFFP
jgi:hypothetical protein